VRPYLLQEAVELRVALRCRLLDVHEPRDVAAAEVLVLDGRSGGDVGLPAVALPVEADEDVAARIRLPLLPKLVHDRPQAKRSHGRARGIALVGQLARARADEDAKA